MARNVSANTSSASRSGGSGRGGQTFARRPGALMPPARRHAMPSAGRASSWPNPAASSRPPGTRTTRCALIRDCSESRRTLADPDACRDRAREMPSSAQPCALRLSGAAQESNLLTVGLPRPAGLEVEAHLAVGERFGSEWHFKWHSLPFLRSTGRSTSHFGTLADDQRLQVECGPSADAPPENCARSRPTRVPTDVDLR